MRIVVLGTGYLGITHAACLASAGLDVLGVDIDQAKVDKLSAGLIPIYEPGLAYLVDAGVRSGRLRFTTSYDAAATFGDVHFICTGTPPLDEFGTVDLSQVRACLAELVPRLDRPVLVVGKSTVPVGTAREIARELAAADSEAEIAWNPDFMREGTAVADTLRPERIVVGVTSRKAENQLRQIYDPQIERGARFLATTLETAELAKLAANAFLATKISFINMMADACEVIGGDVKAVSNILGTDSRIGATYLQPGLGFGGGCLTKDIRAFRAWAQKSGIESAVNLLSEIDKVNLRHRSRMADLAVELVGGDLNGHSACVLGAAFKPGCDDVRDSPALDVARILYGYGASVTVYDPVARTAAEKAFPDFQYARSVADAAKNASVVVLLTDWSEFVKLIPSDLDDLVKFKNIVDGRNVLNQGLWQRAGWNYRALGVETVRVSQQARLQET